MLYLILLGLVVPVMVIVAGVILWVRNQRVYAFRGSLLKGISSAANRDIRRGNHSWTRRYDAYEAVTYNEMFWQFWKPLRSFYPDTSFAEMPPEEDTP